MIYNKCYLVNFFFEGYPNFTQVEPFGSAYSSRVKSHYSDLCGFDESEMEQKVGAEAKSKTLDENHDEEYDAPSSLNTM